MRQNEKAILQTLCYSDIFDYPLTLGEIWRYLSVIPTHKKKFLDLITVISGDTGTVSFKNGFFCLKGREEIIRKRITKKTINIKKITLAKKITAILSLIPTIQLIGISGSLAVENADLDEDIDFFIIAKKHTLWITRLFVLFILEILGKRRRRNMHKVTDTICVNLLMDETHLLLPKNKQNFYTAHEIAQLQPIFERDSTYKKFLKANKWTIRFLPNFLSKQPISMKRSIIPSSFSVLFSFLERPAKQLQNMVIARHKTSEIITNTFLAFHPHDYEKFVLETYNKKLHAYGI